MGKRQFICLVLLLTPGLGLAQEQFVWERAAYWDARYPHSWASNGVAMRDALSQAGYKVLNADALKTWMNARIADRALSVVVFCRDVIPDTVAESKTTNCTIRKYLDAGGKVVWYGDIPFYYQGRASGMQTTWGTDGSYSILGMNAALVWDSGTQVAITAEGAKWGLTETWNSVRAGGGAGLTVLATDGGGNAAAWARHYVAYDKYRGFVRFWDRWGDPNPADVMRLAEYVDVKASHPRPPDGATGVTESLLQWDAGRAAAYHNIYLGVTAELTAANQVGNRRTSTEYRPPAGLTPGTTYYWRVDEIQTGGKTYLGDVWTFATAARTAHSPGPASGNIGVDVYPLLTWKPGWGATRHHVFFGTSFEEVEAGTRDASRGQFTVREYAPGALDPETTYYWRVDEFDGVRTYQGDVWHFTTKGPPGGLKGQYYTDTYLGNLVVTQVDPEINFWWGTQSPSPWMNADYFSVKWTGEIQAPSSEPYTFITRSDDGVRLYVNDRQVINNWTDHSLSDNHSERINLVAGRWYPIRMEFYEATGDATAVLEWESPSTSRQLVPAHLLSPPCRAYSPRPADLSTVSLGTKVILAWSSGDKAGQHDVYFGDAQEAVGQADPTDQTGVYRGRQSSTNHALSDTLQRGRTYYWRIDECNSDGTVSEGNVWSFTVADYVVIDDFETYGSTIDTFTDSAGDSAATEWAIVHEGSRSMTFTYQNGFYPYFSKLERSWYQAQDWTRYGAKKLTLWFCGKAANTPAPLFVGLRDSFWKSALVPQGDPAAVTVAEWQRWDIDLQDFNLAGVNVAKVVSLSIVLGDPLGQQAGGSGTVFLDDIRLTDLTE